eukprot:1832002-Pleurochrysis_carterae.AAC.4
MRCLLDSLVAVKRQADAPATTPPTTPVLLLPPPSLPPSPPEADADSQGDGEEDEGGINSSARILLSWAGRVLLERSAGAKLVVATAVTVTAGTVKVGHARGGEAHPFASSPSIFELHSPT